MLKYFEIKKLLWIFHILKCKKLKKTILQISFFKRKIYCDSHQILKWTLCLFYAEIFCYIFLFHAGTVCKWMNCIAVSANSRSNLHDPLKQYSQVKWQYIDDTVKTWQNNTTILDVMMTLVHVWLACQLHARQPYNDKICLIWKLIAVVPNKLTCRQATPIPTIARMKKCSWKNSSTCVKQP